MAVFRAALPNYAARRVGQLAKHVRYIPVQCYSAKDAGVGVGGVSSPSREWV